jgi:hypothetical protein
MGTQLAFGAKSPAAALLSSSIEKSKHATIHAPRLPVRRQEVPSVSMRSSDVMRDASDGGEPAKQGSVSHG